MFTTTHIPTDLKDVRPRAVDGEEDRRAVDLHFAIRPFTPALARELGVRGHLFSDSDLPRAEVASIVFALDVGGQRVKFGPKDAPPGLVLPNCTISKLAVRRATDSPDFILSFVASFEFPDRSQLEYLVQAMARQHFLTIEELEPGLFEAEPEAVVETA